MPNWRTQLRDLVDWSQLKNFTEDNMEQWKYTLQFKDLMDDYQDGRKDFQTIAKEAKERIITFQYQPDSPFGEDDRFHVLAEELGNAVDDEAFDIIMTFLYDICDEERIWVA